MKDQTPESDWKAFRKLREQALEAFCAQTVSEIANLAEQPTRSAHQNYRGIYSLIQERDDTIARVFDAPRRSPRLAIVRYALAFVRLVIPCFTRVLPPFSTAENGYYV